MLGKELNLLKAKNFNKLLACFIIGKKKLILVPKNLKTLMSFLSDNIVREIKSYNYKIINPIINFIGLVVMIFIALVMKIIRFEYLKNVKEN